FSPDTVFSLPASLFLLSNLLQFEVQLVDVNSRNGDTAMSAAIRSRSPLRTPLIAATLLLFILVLLLFAVNSVYARRGPRGGERLTIASMESPGLVTFEPGYTFAGTEVGGLSGIAYD